MDFDGTAEINSQEGLTRRLLSVRRGDHGAFMLSHGGDESLWVFFNSEAAFLTYYPDMNGNNAGFVPDQMWNGEQQSCTFRLISRFESDTIEIPWWQLIDVDSAIRAAVEYLESPSLPRSVTWFEL